MCAGNVSVGWGGGKWLGFRPLDFKGMGFEVMNICWTFLAFILAPLKKSSN